MVEINEKEKYVDNQSEIATPFTRHLGIFDPHKNKISASIVGCGAIGSFVSVGLAKMGVVEQELFDFDKVEIENLPVQMHQKSFIGKNKAEATRETVKELCPISVDISINEKWDGQSLQSDVIVSAVDSLEVRKQIWESVKYDSSIKILVDARIGGQAIKVFAIDPSNPDDIKIYDNSLKSTQGSELPCTERGVIDVSLFASSLLIRSIRRWIVSKQKEPYLVFDLSGKLSPMIG